MRDAFAWNVGLLWMECRALLIGMLGSFGWNIGFFWMALLSVNEEVLSSLG